MAITFRQNGPWGAGKDSPLTAEEIDNNFYELVARAEEIEANPAEPLGIQEIAITGSTFSVVLTDASIQGPFALPIGTFNWRGAWQPSTDYAALDLVHVEELGLYVVLFDHESATEFSEAEINTDTNYVYSRIVGETELYDMAVYLPGIPGLGFAEGSPIFQTVIARPIFLAQSSTTHVSGFVYVRVPPFTEDLYCAIRKNGTVIGNITVPEGENLGTITINANTFFTFEDVLSIDQPDIIGQTETGTGTETLTPTDDLIGQDLSITFRAIRSLET